MNHSFTFDELLELSRSLPDTEPLKKSLIDNCYLMIDLIDHISEQEDTDPEEVEETLTAYTRRLFSEKEEGAALKEFNDFLEEKKFPEREDLLLSLREIYRQQKQDGKDSQ